MAGERLRRVLPTPGEQSGLFVLCGLGGLLEVGAWVVVAPFLATGTRPVGLVALLGQRLLVVLALAVVLPGCYAAARDQLGPRAALLTAVDRVGADAPRLLASLLASRVAVVGLTAVALLACLAVLGAIDTAAVWTAAVVGVGVDRTALAVLGVPAAIVGSSMLARGAVGLQDLRAMGSADTPLRAPLWSLCAWRGRARTLLAYAALRGTLLAVPVLGALGVTAVVHPAPLRSLDRLTPAMIGAAAVAFVITTAFARATLVNYQLSTYDEVATAATATSIGSPSLLPRRRGALLAAVLVLGTVVGVGAIRTVDVQPAPEATVDVAPRNPTPTIETAIERTRERDLITDQRTAVHNASAEEWTTTTRREALLQRSDRSIRFYAQDRPAADDRTIYATDGRLAMLQDPTPPASPGFWHLRNERDGWTVIVGHPYGWGLESQFGYPPADADWRLTDWTRDTIVYTLADPSSLAGHDVDALPAVPADAALAEGTSARIVIDRRLLTIRRASVTIEYAGNSGGDPNRVDTRWEREVSKIGDVRASRPGSVGTAGPIARLWDVVYY